MSLLTAKERSTQSRTLILNSLRHNSPTFEDATPRPQPYLPVTRLDSATPDALLERFRAEFECLSGKLYVVEDAEAAIQQIIALLGTTTTRVMGWESLPLPGLAVALQQRGIEFVVPKARGAERFGTYTDMEPIGVGITGADAAFATTGTLALVTTTGQGRLPSLLPPVHIAILRRDRLYPRLEAWIADAGRSAFIEANSVVFITGPSRTGDIEGQLILGVHGPGEVHVIVV